MGINSSSLYRTSLTAHVNKDDLISKGPRKPSEGNAPSCASNGTVSAKLLPHLLVEPSLIRYA